MPKLVVLRLILTHYSVVVVVVVVVVDGGFDGGKQSIYSCILLGDTTGEPDVPEKKCRVADGGSSSLVYRMIQSVVVVILNN